MGNASKCLKEGKEVFRHFPQHSDQGGQVDLGMEMVANREAVLPDPSDQVSLIRAIEIFNLIGNQLTESNARLEKKVEDIKGRCHEESIKRLEENAYKEQLEKQFDYLLETLPVGVVILGSSGFVSQCNASAVDLLGEPLLGEKWLDIIARSFSPKADDGHEVSLRDGRLVNISTRSSQDGNYQLIVITDLTETRRLQSRIEKNRRIWELGKMSAALAHQIRTPLSSAMLFTSQLKDYQFDENQRTVLCDRIMQSLKHLETQIRDVLTFVRPGESSMHLVSIREIWKSVEQSMVAFLLANNAKLKVTFRSECDGLERKVRCNRDALQGSLMNIVQNGIEAAVSKKEIGALQEDPEVQVYVRFLDSSIEIRIKDNGGGIPEKARSQMFEPFFSTKQNGTGLGLSVVKQVMDMHGFEIEIEIDESIGTTFVLHCS